MCYFSRFILLLTLIAIPITTYADTGESTRVVDANQHSYAGSGRVPGCYSTAGTVSGLSI